MNSWYTVKVKYTKQLDDGTFKRVTEPYLIAAMTHGEAEERIYEELGSVVRGEFLVTGIVPADIHEIFHYDDSDVWYKAVIKYESESDDEGRKSKSIKQTLLVSAHSVKDAYERIQESLSGMMIDYAIPSCVLSPIVDIFPFNDKNVEYTGSEFMERINGEIQRSNGAKSVEKWAKLLDGRQYREEITSDECKYAYADNVVIVFGASDDLTEFRGAIHDERGTGDLYFTSHGDFYDEPADTMNLNHIQTTQCPFSVSTEIPHKTFRIFEDMELYGTGIVFHVNDLI